VLFWPLWMSKMLRKRKKTENDKNVREAIAAIIDLFIDLTGLRPIIFDDLDVFRARGSNLVLSTKNFESAGFLGPSMTSSKP